MKSMLAVGTLMIGLLLMLPENAQSQNKEKNKNANVVPATPQDYKNLARTKEVIGIVVSADVKALTFRIDMPHMQPNAGQLYGKRRRGGGKVVHDYKEYDLGVADNVVVKKMHLNADYDDKGNFKINEAAQKELRSKGFIAATIGDIKSGNIAKLVLTMPKTDAKEEGVGNITKPVVKTIYLVQEGTPIESSKAPEKKKKG